MMMPYLKVITSPHPRKAAIDRQITIITNRYVSNSIEQSIVIAHGQILLAYAVKNIEVISRFRQHCLQY